MSKKTLFLHIGHFKTGTTALQVCCRNNAKLLEEKGLGYSNRLEHNAKHSVLAFSLYHAAGVNTLMHGYDRDEPPETFWHDLFDEVRESKFDRFLASTEELMRLAEFPEAAARLKQIVEKAAHGIDIKVIVYLRPPADQVGSWYNQIVKMRMRVGEFDSALANGRIEAIHYDYERALRPWIDIFGKDAVIIRRYPDHSQPRDAIFHDFFDAMGIDISASELTLLPNANPRLDDRMLDLVRQVRNAGAKRDEVDDLRNQMGQYLKRQHYKRADGAGVVMAQERMEAGLAALAQITGENFSDYASPITPRPVGPDVEALALQVGFLQTEVLALQRELELRRANQAGARLRRKLRKWKLAVKRLART